MDAWQASDRPLLAIFYGKQAVNTLQASGPPRYAF